MRKEADMKLIFIRHGEGEHTGNLPHSLQISHPSLTYKGENQARLLRDTLPLKGSDVLIVSPTIRTLQTAALWGEHVDCIKIVHPAVAPRIFPYKEDARTLPCDCILGQQDIQSLFPQFSLAENESLWGDEINTISPCALQKVITDFMKWCYKKNAERVCVVSHDGTIAAYREHIKKETLTREDFLAETGIHEMILPNMEGKR